MKKKLIIVPVLLLSIVFYSAAQKIDSALNILASQHSLEKIYIQYDKEYYVAGETIWLKAYLYNEGKPSNISNNLYLQLIDSKGNIVTSKKYPALGAIAKGNIEIPDSLPQGNYYIRALTPGMLNNDEAFIYKKNIFVFKPGINTATAKQPQNVSLQFFPESGYLVDGVLSVVAFKAVDQWGTPVEINGFIHTEDGTTIASFKSFHDGIGKVPFKPQAGKKYIAEVETDAGKRAYPLPEVQPSGINLKIQDEKGGKKFQLSRSEKDKAQLDNLLLVAEMNDHVIYENEISFEDYPSVIGHLITDSLPSGILHFTVFNKDMMPLAERLSFVDNGEYRSAGDVVATKVGVEKRAANTFEISFPDAIQRSCSVAVIDLPQFSINDNDNIFSRFLLTSDLKGYIYNPSWYFEKQNDTTRMALDNLMLTHGWSRFSWAKILAGEFQGHLYKDGPYISISGKVMDEKNKQVLSGGKLNILAEAEDSSEITYETMVDSKGTFKIDSMIFSGKTKFYYAYTDSKEKPRPISIEIDDNNMGKNISSVPANSISNLIQRNFVVAQNKNEIDTRYNYAEHKLEDVKELEKVTVQSQSNKKPIDEVNDKYSSGVFRSMGNVNLDNINQPANDKSISAEEYIKNNIQAIEIQNGQFVNRKNVSLMSGQKWLIGVFLNDAPANIGLLRNIRMQDVALIKFYEAGFVGVGSSYPGGAVAVYTKERFVDEVKPDKLSFFECNGYSVTKTFYSPDYSGDAKHAVTDNRTTLYWNPDAYTDTETKSIKVNFFNNDISKKFKIVVEGFDAAGKLIHIEKTIGN